MIVKFITYSGDESKCYKYDYNTMHFTENELEKMCWEWTMEDGDGTMYYLQEDEICDC